MPRIGILSPGPREAVTPIYVEPFLDGLRELGYGDGRDVAIEQRWSDRDDQLPELAAELVSLGVDVILTRGIFAAVAAKQATGTIPIVIAAVGDPVGAGLVDSLAEPGGNVTGLSTLGTGTDMKRLELLKAIVPAASRVGVLVNPDKPTFQARFDQFEAAARVLAMQLQLLPVRTPDDFTGLFEAAVGGRVDALLVPSDVLTINHRGRVVDLAAKSRLPALYEHREFADIGGLVNYGPNFSAQFRRAAAYVDKILRGAKPADLPVEQPTTFDFIVNLKTARALGLSIPPSVLQQATEVIQ